MNRLLTINNVLRRCGVVAKSTILAIVFAAVAQDQMANAQEAEDEPSLATEDDDEVEDQDGLSLTSEVGDDEALPEGSCGGANDNSLLEGSCGGAKIEKSLMTEDDDEEAPYDESPDAETPGEPELPDSPSDTDLTIN